MNDILNPVASLSKNPIRVHGRGAACHIYVGGEKKDTVLLSLYSRNSRFTRPVKDLDTRSCKSLLQLAQVAARTGHVFIKPEALEADKAYKAAQDPLAGITVTEPAAPAAESPAPTETAAS